MQPIEFTQAGVAASIGVLLIAAACIRLGFWQLERRTLRLEANAAVSERLAEPPAHLTAPPLDTLGLTHRRATISGLTDDTRTIILGARSLGGTPGVHIYSPVRIGDGAVLVNRGWVPSPDAATVDLSRLSVDTAITATGVLVPIPETGAPGSATSFRTTWFRLDAAAVRAQYPYPLSPLYLQAVAPDPEASALASRTGSAETPVPLPAPALDAGPHMSYAIQWFSFAAIALVGWGALVMRGRGGIEPRAGNKRASGAL